jgi:catechol 2,3-dioxygenase-like lactoylglutathione lyase family enzyme
MRLRHAALACSSEERADAFYAGLLGLEKGPAKTLPASLANAFFSIDAPLRTIYYTGNRLEIEVFITGAGSDRPAGVDHLCLEVEDLSAFLEQCRTRGYRVLRLPKGETHVTFVFDADGNRFEIKAADHRP